jgi:hypothetical protein
LLAIQANFATKINPYLECVIETNPDALEHARMLDDERLNGRVKGPLHGVPVLVKDVGLLCGCCLCPSWQKTISPWTYSEIEAVLQENPFFEVSHRFQVDVMLPTGELCRAHVTNFVNLVEHGNRG